MILLAVSGGRDSVVMADMMHREGRMFAIAHCNFHLRPGDCDRDQLFVQHLAEGYGVPFYTTDFDTRAYASGHGMSIEEAARHLRYSYFAELCREHRFEAVATAHHRDDSIETFFLNLFRGTGISGLHGIRPVSTQTIKHSSIQELTIVRPLLNLSRADIDAYIAEHGLKYVEDYTNSQLDARRNRIRHQLMPLLRELYPSIDTTMQANIDRLYDTELIYRNYICHLLTTLLQPYFPKLPTLPVCNMMSVDRLKRELGNHPQWPESTERTLMFELLRPCGFNAYTAAAILRSLDAPSGAVFHSPSHTAELHRGSLIIMPDLQPAEPGIIVEELPYNGNVAQAIKQSGNQNIVVDADSVRQPFTIRPWSDGDRFCPFGMKGSKLVSDFLKDSGLPLVERRHVYMLVDADDMPVWVVGLRADNRTRVIPSTSRILKISCQARPRACADGGHSAS